MLMSIFARSTGSPVRLSFSRSLSRRSRRLSNCGWRAAVRTVQELAIHTISTVNNRLIVHLTISGGLLLLTALQSPCALPCLKGPGVIGGVVEFQNLIILYDGLLSASYIIPASCQDKLPTCFAAA